MCDSLKVLVGKEVYPFSDLYGIDKDGKQMETKLLDASKKYKVIAVVDEPKPYCFIVKNDVGVFDVVHISNFKVPEGI